LLLHVWVDHAGDLYWYAPAYQISPAREREESTEAGRQNYRQRGKWTEWTAPVIADGGAVKLQCRHCNTAVRMAELVALAEKSEQQGQPIHLRV
jgi:hypothetical protein